MFSTVGRSFVPFPFSDTGFGTALEVTGFFFFLVSAAVASFLTALSFLFLFRASSGSPLVLALFDSFRLREPETSTEADLLVQVVAMNVWNG
jgi:hypothetical protein